MTITYEFVVSGTVNINFPALADLVAYLNNKQQSQQQIDALTAQVKQLTDSLTKSGADLQGSVDKEGTREQQ